MVTTITRIRDGATLPMLPQTRLQVGEDTFGFSRTQAGVLGTIGEMIQIDSVLNQKLFTWKFVTVDTSGAEQDVIERFFTSGEIYQLSDSEYSRIDNIWATVDEVDTTFKSVSISFTSFYGDFVTQQRTTLSSQSLAGGANSVAYSGSFTNGWDTEALIQLTLTANVNTYWKSGTAVNVTGIPFVISRQDDFGNWNLTQQRKSIIFNSKRLIVGEGYYRYAGTQFYKIQPGATKAISLPSIVSPLVSPGISWTLLLEAVATRQAGS